MKGHTKSDKGKEGEVEVQRGSAKIVTSDHTIIRKGRGSQKITYVMKGSG